MTSRRANFILTHFRYLAAKLLLLIFLNVFLQTNFVTQVFITCKTVYWFTDLFLCDKDMKITVVQLNQNVNRYWKQLRSVTMLKKRLYLGLFLASFVNFCITTAFETFCELFFKFWVTASRLNRVFVNVIKIINLTILKLCPIKLTRISFLMKSCFILSDYSTA